MASLLLGPKSGPLHDTTAAYTFSFLEKDAIDRLAEVSKRDRKFIKTEYPKYDRAAPKYKPLTPLQKLELEFIKFQDRPVWQRIGIVVVCTVFSPVIFAYHSPKLVDKFYVSIIVPCAQSVARNVEAAAMKVYTYALAPLGRFTRDYVLVPSARAIRKIATLTYDRVLVPLAKTIQEAAEFIFVTFPNYLYQSVLLPSARAIREIAILTYNHVLAPLGRTISDIAQFVFVTFPTHLYQSVLKPVVLGVWNHLIVPVTDWIWNSIAIPVATQIRKLATFLFDQVVVPVAKVIRAILKGICVTLPSKIYAHILAPTGRTIGRALHFTYEKILTPIGQAIQRIASIVFNQFVLVILKGVCVTFPTKIYAHILAPTGRAIGRAFKFTYEKILTPIGQVIQKVASTIFNRFVLVILKGVCVTFPAKIYAHILAPIGRSIKAALDITYEKVLTPIGQTIQQIASTIFNQIAQAIRLGGEILYTNVIVPVTTLIVSLPSIVERIFSRDR